MRAVDDTVDSLASGDARGAVAAMSARAATPVRACAASPSTLSLDRRLLDAIVAAENRRRRSLHLVAVDGIDGFMRALDRLRDASAVSADPLRARVLLPLESPCAHTAPLYRTMGLAAFDVRTRCRQVSVIGVDPRATSARIEALCALVGAHMRDGGFGTRFLMVPRALPSPTPRPPLSGLNVALAMHESVDFFDGLHDDLPSHYLDAVRIDCTQPLKPQEQALLLAINTMTWRRLDRELPPVPGDAADFSLGWGESP